MADTERAEEKHSEIAGLLALGEVFRRAMRVQTPDPPPAAPAASAPHVVDRHGNHVPVRFDAITSRNEDLMQNPAYGPKLQGINSTLVTELVVNCFRDGMTTRELDHEAAQACVSLSTHAPGYESLAARIHVSDLHKRTPQAMGAMIDALLASAPARADVRISDELAAVVRRGAAEIEARLDAARDYRFRIFGFQTLARSYLQRVGGGPRVASTLLSDVLTERPQHLYMRVALGIFVCQPDGRGHEAPEPVFAARLREALEMYDALSLHCASNATPTLLNAGTPVPQLSSCFQLATGDDLGALFDTLKQAALTSKWSGGISLWLHNVRAKGSPIRGTGGTSSGLRGYLSILNHTQTYSDQGGNRPGAFAIYLSPDHADIITFLEMARPKGEQVSAPKLKYALWVPDLFMETLGAQIANAERARAGGRDDPAAGDWHLFDPARAPGLHLVYGEAYRALYRRYVAEGRAVAVVKAGDIIEAAFKTWATAGIPYVLFKDAINRKSNMRNVAPISSSNLCVAAGTLVLTDKGYRRVDELARLADGSFAAAGGLAAPASLPVRLWNGRSWSDGAVACTAESAELVQLTFSNGAILDCTPEHAFYVALAAGAAGSERAAEPQRVRAADLCPGDELEAVSAWPLDATPSAEGSHPVRVASARPLPGRHRVFCVNEPERHRAVFNGVLTGNCCEITIPSWSDHDAATFAAFHPGNDPARGETGVCNLAAICLKNFVVAREAGRPATVDYAGLASVAALEARALNRVIDINHYPSEEGRRSNRRHRPIGIGIMGLADVFARLGLAYGSEPARQVARAIAASVHFGALRESARLAEAEGPYESFKGSPISQGLLQPDLWVEAGDLAAGWEDEIEALTAGAVKRADWEALRRQICATGVRNAYVTAYMPTASTSSIVGQNESFEPYTSNIYTRETMAGEFYVVNETLMAELDALGLWSEKMRRSIIGAGGSIRKIREIPREVRKRYRTAREIKPARTIQMAKAMAPFICQSMSMNLYLAAPHLGKILNFLFEGWRAGLKTGVYYVHTMPASGSQKSSVRNPAGSGPAGGFVAAGRPSLAGGPAPAGRPDPVGRPDSVGRPDPVGEPDAAQGPDDGPSGACAWTPGCKSCAL